MSVGWQQEHPVEDGREVVVLGGVLQLRSIRHLPRFLKWNREIQRQLAASNGLVRYSLRARFRTLEFDALSVWADRAALASFARSGAHASGVRDLQQSGAMASTRFLTWEHRAGTLWPTWDDLAARMRIGLPVTHEDAHGVRDSG